MLQNVPENHQMIHSTLCLLIPSVKNVRHEVSMIAGTQYEEDYPSAFLQRFLQLNSQSILWCMFCLQKLEKSKSKRPTPKNKIKIGLTVLCNWSTPEISKSTYTLPRANSTTLILLEWSNPSRRQTRPSLSFLPIISETRMIQRHSQSQTLFPTHNSKHRKPEEYQS